MIDWKLHSDILQRYTYIFQNSILLMHTEVVRKIYGNFLCTIWYTVWYMQYYSIYIQTVGLKPSVMQCKEFTDIKIFKIAVYARL